jgi:hypothetical protein
VEVACVVDDGAAGGGSLCGVPVVRPSAMPAGVDAVVLSSDAHELALLGAVRRAFGGGVRVVSPYGSDGASAGAGSGDAGVFVAA